MKQNYVRQSEPVMIFTLAEIKAEAKIVYTDEDDLLPDMIQEVIDWAEDFTWRAFNVSNWKVYCDGWYYLRAGKATDSILFRRNPVDSITTVQYYDTDNVLQTLDSGDYYLSNSTPSQLRYTDGVILPNLYARPDSVVIDFVAGSTTIPKGIMGRLKELITYRIHNRDARFLEGRLVNVSERRLGLYRLRSF